MLLSSAIMFYNGRWRIGAAALILFLLFGYLSWMNVERILRDDPADDERMEKINTHAAASSFWTVFNLGMLSFIARMILGIGAGSLPGTKEQIVAAAPGLSIGILFVLYASFRGYYLKFGVDSKFWRLD
nr:MAG: hypothetical protein J07AB56_01290 [Candidatus Nanosalinarum sp. J07AB56]